MNFHEFEYVLDYLLISIVETLAIKVLQMIEKPKVLVTSLGRTGTEFFCKVVFSPDIVQNVGI